MPKHKKSAKSKAKPRKTAPPKRQRPGEEDERIAIETPVEDGDPNAQPV